MNPINASAGAVAKRLGKRKVRDVPAETSAAAAADHRFNLHSHNHNHHLASSSNPTNGRRSRIRHVLNNAASTPFSFMDLLTGNDGHGLEEEEDDAEEEEEDYEYYPVARDVENQTDQIDQMLTYHNESLRQSVLGMLEKHNHTLHCAAEERAAKRFRDREVRLQETIEQNAELERMVELYKGESERLLRRVRYLEQTAMSLSDSLHEANQARRYAEAVEEEGESSFEDPDRVGPVRLDCKVCARQLATVMVWPCRHICVCSRCEPSTKYCPVCRAIKTTSVEVCIPLD